MGVSLTFNTGLQLLWAIMAPMPVDPVDRTGWELRAVLLDSPPVLIPGEELGSWRIKVTLRNRSKEARRYVPLAKAAAARKLDLIVARPNGDNDADIGLHRDKLEEENWPVLKSGEHVELLLEPKQFGFHSIGGKPGKLNIAMTFETNEGKVASPSIELTVIDVAEKSILADIALPPIRPDIPPNQQSRCFLQQLRLSGDVYLYYRSFEPEKDGNRPDGATRLAQLKSKTEMIVSGSWGINKSVYVSYAHSPEGLTVLKLGIGGGVLKKQVFE